MATVTKSKKTRPGTDEDLALLLAGDIIYTALLDAGEPLKASEVAKAADRPEIDTKLARVVLTTNSHMTAVDRKWTLWSRYLDASRTVDHTMQRILNTYGKPMRTPQLARELHSVYGRPAEIYIEMLEHLVETSGRYFTVTEDLVAPSNWLLDIESDDADDVLFYNFLSPEEVAAVTKAAQKAGVAATHPETISAFLDTVDRPVGIMTTQYLAWLADPSAFEPVVFYRALVLESGATLLSDGTCIGPVVTARIAKQFPIIAQREVSDNAEAEAQEAAQPLVVGEAERRQLVEAVLGAEGVVRASQLLEDIFEVTPDYRTYTDDLHAVIQGLSEDEQVQWVGSDRFRPQGSIPGYVFTVPALLEIADVRVLDADGNLVDQLLETEGFDGGLEREIVNPVAQDVLDEEPVPSPDMNPPSTARAVIKYHHKQIGTLPLCQFTSGFFPPEPAILETEFTLPSGQKTTVWVNNETRLLYGLLDWFQSIPIDSGATFTLAREAPDAYTISYNDETEPAMFISRNRINELLGLVERSEAEQMATFDILREIMEHYRKGIEYVTLLTEVNIVRRVRRRMIASLLSEYHCFFQRGGSWVYDAKKYSLGFDKSKRKYLVK